MPPISASLPSDLKYTNRTRLLRAMMQSGEVEISELSEKTGLSRQTVMRAVRYFVERGLVVSRGKGDSTLQGGKKPERFALSDERYFLCLSLWPDTLSACVWTLGREKLVSRTVEGPLEAEPAAAVERAARLGRSLLADYELPESGLFGVSLSVAGVVDAESGLLRYSS